MKKLAVFVIAFILSIALAMPAMAKVKIGGIIFVDSYIYSRDQEFVAGGVPQGGTTAESDLSTLDIRLNHTSRYKVTWTNEDNVGMYLEVGVGGVEHGQNLYTRHFYGWWDATPTFRIMFGQSTTPFSPLNPGQVISASRETRKVIGIGYGNFYSGRFSQVRFSFKLPNKMGKFEMAFCDPVVSGSPFAAKAGAASNNDTTFPRVDIGMPLNFANVKLYPSAFYQKQTFDDVAAGSDDEIVTYGLSLGAKTAFGPLGIAAEINYGQNWAYQRALFRPILGVPPNVLPWVSATGQVEDAEHLGYWFDVSFKYGQATPHLIFGAYHVECDNSANPNDDTDIDTMMYGVSIPISLAKGFTLRPEFMVYDDGDDNEVNGVTTDYGKETVAGVRFQIVF